MPGPCARGHANEERNGILTWRPHVLVITYLIVLAVAWTTARAAPIPRRWHAPTWWLRQATCVHQHEGAWNSNTGNGYFGGMQFLISTWRSVGGPSYPHLVSPREQLYRAWLVWRRDGDSWREWGTARACGLR